MSKKNVSAEDFDGPVRRLRSGSYRDILDADQIVDTSGSQQGGKLKPFWDAMENRNITGDPVDILVIGDSIMTNETAALSTTQRVIEVFQQKLTEKFGNGYGIYYQARGAGGSFGYPWTITGFTAADNIGLGQGNSCLIDADADLATLTTLTACDRIGIAYRADGVNAGIMRINIDGGANIDITTTGSVDTLWDSGPLTAGVHTVTVKRVPSTGGSFVLEGAMIEYGCRNPGGVRIWDSAHSGIGAIEFGANTVWTQSIGTTKIVNPDFIIISLGENDMGDGEPAFSTGIDQVIAALLAVAPKATCAYMMHTPWGFSNSTTDIAAPINASIRIRCTNNEFALADMHAWTKHFMFSDDSFTFDAVHPWRQGVQFIVRSFMYGLGLANSPKSMTLRCDVPGTYPFYYPEGTIRMHVRLRGGGGGGGSGRCGLTSVIRCGGGGGGGGGTSDMWIDTSGIPNDGTYYLSVGVKGTGGTARTTTNDGLPGTFGGTTWLASANSVNNIFLQAGRGNGGAGGTVSTGVGGTAGQGTFIGGDGGAASATGLTGGAGLSPFPAFTAGGGAGGGLTAANVASNGGNGGWPAYNVAFSAAISSPGGVVGGALPGGGSNFAGGIYGLGAGGGASAVTTPAQSGAGCVGVGCGGGGSGASLNGQSTGTGGDGGPGCAEILCIMQ